MHDYDYQSQSYNCFKNNNIRFIGFDFWYYDSNARFICFNIDSSLIDYVYGCII
jgi:hypothetical protein